MTVTHGMGDGQTVYVVGHDYSPGVDAIAIYSSEEEARKHADAQGCDVFPWTVSQAYQPDEGRPE